MAPAVPDKSIPDDQDAAKAKAEESGMRMLDKIAQAICEQTYGWREMSMPSPWHDHVKQKVAMEAARAAVEAMREPPDAILEAGLSTESGASADYIWDSIIDAILNEPQP